MIGKPIGQTGFISSPITRVENAPEFQRCRPRGGDRPDFRGTQPPTDEQIKKVADYESHTTARTGAARAGTRRVISTEELNSKAAVDARSAAIGSAITSQQVEALEARLAAQQVVIDVQATAIAELQAHRGNDAFIGDQS